MYPVYPNFKKICRISKRCCWHIPRVSFLNPVCMSLSYAVHIPVINLSGSAKCGWPIKSCRQLNCCSISEYHYTVFFEHDRTYLFPAALRNLSSSAGSPPPSGQRGVFLHYVVLRGSWGRRRGGRRHGIPGVRRRGPPAASEACDEVPGVLSTSSPLALFMSSTYVDSKACNALR